MIDHPPTMVSPAIRPDVPSLDEPRTRPAIESFAPATRLTGVLGRRFPWV
jgi:hypothetical protein